MKNRKYYCNPLNFSYKYQFNKQSDGKIRVSREAADPSMILFRDRYYIFPSMTCGFLYSDDMTDWKFHPTPKLPSYDYAPDVRVVGEYVYFCASNHEEGRFFRTKDLFSDTYEEFKSQFPFWDPDLFLDDDGRMYFYYGSFCDGRPVYGIELNPENMMPVSERVELIFPDPESKGFERGGENHTPNHTPEEVKALLEQLEHVPGMSDEMKASAKAYLTNAPYVEGAWMTKHNGIYYLQYGTPGAGVNVYADGLYVSRSPLGPFVLADNNPFSYKPGGFIPGAGHGSTMEDRYSNLWHISTARICVNHNFERRICLWPSGFDADDEMFCNQRYGDWPVRVEQSAFDPWAEPEWMLLSHGKTVTASSCAEGGSCNAATDENVRTWWKAASGSSGEWLMVDLGEEYEVHAIQINFADDNLILPLPEGASLTGALHQERWIDEVMQRTRWILEGSGDGEEFFMIEDKSQVETDLPHDLIVREDGIRARYIRLTIIELPYDQNACVSGLRVFGLGEGEKPDPVSEVTAVRKGALDLEVSWEGSAAGYVVEWGHSPEKLYHSWQVFQPSAHIGGLVKGQDVYIRVDSFNDSGITHGKVVGPV